MWSRSGTGTELGGLLAKSGIRIVYGGAQVGSMGALAGAALDEFAEVLTWPQLGIHAKPPR